MRAVTPGTAAGGVKYRLSPAKLSNAGVVNGAATACSCALVLAGSESVPLLGPVPLSPPHAVAPSATQHATNQLCFRTIDIARLREGLEDQAHSPHEAVDFVS